MSSYFLACARSAPTVVAASPDAVGLLQVQGVAPLGLTDATTNDEDLIPTLAGAEGVGEDDTSSPSSYRLPVGQKGRRVDGRQIDRIISQTRALLDGPHAADLRLHLAREDALQAKAVAQAQRQAQRADEIDQRNRKLLADKEKAAEEAARLAALASITDVDRPPTSASGSATAVNTSAVGVATVYQKHPLSTHAISHLDIDDAVQTDDAFRMLRVEEVRRRLEAQRQSLAGGSIVARYTVEDAFVADASAAATAEALVDYTPTTVLLPSVARPQRQQAPPLSTSVVKISSIREYADGLNRTSDIHNNTSGGGGSQSKIPRLGLVSIDEASAEERAKEKAQRRLESLSDASASDASLAARVRSMEQREVDERRARAVHSNEERQRALDESRALLNAARRKAVLVAKRDGKPYDAAAEPTAAEAVVPRPGTALIGGLQPGTSLIRSVPSTRDGRLESNELRETDRALKLSAKPLHPIDTYQLKVREDLMRQRGWDADSIADSSPTAEMSLLALAAQHQRVGGQMHLRGI